MLLLKKMCSLTTTTMMIGIILILQTFNVAIEATTVSALPGCPASCANITIPFPFGIGTDCHYDGFEVICNQTYHPPRLFLSDGTTQVLDIFLQEGIVHAKSNILTLPNGEDGNVNIKIIDDGPFSLSTQRNLLVAFGCGAIAQAIDLDLDDPISACVSLCGSTTPDPNLLNRSCTGVLCCQTSFDSVPFADKSYALKLTNVSPRPVTPVEIPQRNSALLVEREWFTNNFDKVKTLLDPFSGPPSYGNSMVIPFVLDWTYRPLWSTCQCLSKNSKCYYVNNTGGFKCSCQEGFEGNPYMTQGCQGMIIFIGVITGFGLIILLLASLLLIRWFRTRRSKKLKRKFFKRNHGLLLQQLISSNDIAERMKIFSLGELEKATNKFDQTRIVGRGGHGIVYKGILSDQRVVAIKKASIMMQSEIDQFINEVAILSQIDHRNVVKLYGCCLESQVPLLVYEFISNGTLFDHLHREGEGYDVLSWKDRFRIALETARALAHLHSAASISVFHRDIKSANILLDDYLTVKVSDFGASRLIPIDHTGINTVIQGTHGYLDPEYHYTGRLTEKSDVFSFGVILAELLTREKPISILKFEAGENLAAHFCSAMRRNRLDEILDPQITEEEHRVDIVAVASLAESCLRLRGDERPTMKQVETRLEVLQGSKKRHLLASAKGTSSALNDQFAGNDSTRQYSLENELLSSSHFPR